MQMKVCIAMLLASILFTAYGEVISPFPNHHTFPEVNLEANALETIPKKVLLCASNRM